jgi:hypothetical protein
MLRTMHDGDVTYPSLAFVCPGCMLDVYDLPPDGATYHPTGLHLLPVNTDQTSPTWTFDGNEEAPTVSPSILTQHHPTDTDGRPDFVCHSFLVAGVFQFLGDCTHALAGLHVPMLDLPDWFVNR